MRALRAAMILVGWTCRIALTALCGAVVGVQGFHLVRWISSELAPWASDSAHGVIAALTVLSVSAVGYRWHNKLNAGPAPGPKPEGPPSLVAVAEPGDLLVTAYDPDHGEPPPGWAPHSRMPGLAWRVSDGTEPPDSYQAAFRHAIVHVDMGWSAHSPPADDLDWTVRSSPPAEPR